MGAKLIGSSRAAYTGTMTTAKQETLELVRTLPDDVPMETILEQLLLQAKLKESIDQADRGELIPHEQVLEDLARWRQSLGR